MQLLLVAISAIGKYITVLHPKVSSCHLANNQTSSLTLLKDAEMRNNGKDNQTTMCVIMAESEMHTDGKDTSISTSSVCESEPQLDDESLVISTS